MSRIPNKTALYPCVLLGVLTIGVLAEAKTMRSARIFSSVCSNSSKQDVPGQHARDDTLERVSRLVFMHTNRIRDQRGLSRLEQDSVLRRIACKHTWDMHLRSFQAHVNPDGESARDRVAKMHRRLIGRVAENILGRQGQIGRILARMGIDAYAEKIVRDWFGSPSHRETLLTPQLTHLGVCGKRWAFSVRFTQLFAAVRGYLNEPIPYRVEAGGQYSATVSTKEGSAKKYDLWDPSAPNRVLGPFPLEGTVHIPDNASGRYRLRFHFPENEGDQIYAGPEVKVEERQ